MDITKAIAALEIARASIKALVDTEIAARSFNGLRGLAAADTVLTKAQEKLEGAVKRTAPRVKKAKAKKVAGPVAAPAHNGKK